MEHEPEVEASLFLGMPRSWEMLLFKTSGTRQLSTAARVPSRPHCVLVECVVGRLRCLKATPVAQSLGFAGLCGKLEKKY